MKPIEFKINTQPRPWKRPGGNGKKRYTDTAMRAYQNEIAATAMVARVGTEFGSEYESAIESRIAFVLPMPETWTDAKRKTTNMTVRPLTPDCDNLAKNILDACEGVLYQNDKQIVIQRIVKLWGRAGEVYIWFSGVNQTEWHSIENWLEI